MLKLVFALLCLVSAAYSDQGVNWALLVAGSNEYYNYRHQADICHAYQVLHKYGIPDERIVVMMYDDIANNSENPVKGNIINKPNGPDVYKGTVKDYTKGTVTPNNFLNVLQGKSEAMLGIGSGKVINSGPNDNVFVFFSDHGAPGIVAFPDGSVLHASQLNSAIKNMHTNKRYANMVFYIEACESGSMFENLLPENINVYGTTASNAEESSYACYYDDQRQTYLGDVYSVNWMEDSDAEDITSETLNKQFQIVQKLTNTSHVMQYGNLSMSQFFNVSDFQGEASFLQNKPKRHPTGLRHNPNFGAVKTEDVRLSILEKKLAKESNNEQVNLLQKQIMDLKKFRSKTIGLFREIVGVVANRKVEYMNKILNSKSKLVNHMCYRSVIDHLLDKCFSSKNEYALRNFYQMVNLCEDGIKAEQIKYAIDKICVKRMQDF